MNLDKLFSVALAIVAVAGVAVFVTNPSSADVIRATGEAFSGSIKAAQGR